MYTALPLPIPLPVFESQDDSQDDCKEDGDDRGHHDGYLGWDVFGRIAVAEGFWAYDVAQAVWH